MVITPIEDYFSVTALKVGFARKEIQNLWKKRAAGAGKLEELKRTCALAFYPKSYKAIFALSPQGAVTNYETLSFLRDNPRKLIDEAEIDNLISQALLKLFDEGRKMAVKQLGLSELEVLLADVRIYEFKIDGRERINPLRHVGRKIEIFLSETFVSRIYFKELISILPRRTELAMFSGAGEASAHLLSRFSPKRDFIFAGVAHNRTDLFLSKNGSIVFFDYFGWGMDNLPKALSKYLKVGQAVASEVVRKIMSGEVSKGLKRKFSEVIAGEIRTLIKRFQNAASRSKAPLVYAQFPPLLADKIFPKIIKIIDARSVADFFGFKFINKQPVTEEYPEFMTLLTLLEFYFLPEKEDLMNHLARRRMRWLMP